MAVQGRPIGTSTSPADQPLVAAAVRLLSANADVALAAMLMLTVLMMIVPMPAALLDVLIAGNIAAAVTVLLISMYTREVLQFSVFPSLLLMLTLFRLAINVSSTRLILLYGHPGHVIEAFGSFVVGGSLVVGIVVFLILLVIQFIVITNGAGRVAEVAARFTLDAMPGKQMSIDADLNAGLINETEARARRLQIMQEADFYGSMDGASKFVKGDAIAGLIIVAINLVGGIIIGIVQRGLAPAEAVQTYSLLSIGDGLVSQIPALLISTATGLIVTRGASDGNLGSDIAAQLLASPRALFVVAAVLAALGAVPGLPRFPFFVLAATMGGAGYLVRERQRAGAAQAAEVQAVEQDERATSVDSVLTMLQLDPLEVEVGYALIPLVDSERGSSLLNRITVIRRQIASDLGVIVPMIRIRDNLQLGANTYVVRLRGIEIGRGELHANQYLAMDSGVGSEPIEGEDTVEPAFGLPAKWIVESNRQRAEMAGYTVVDPPSVLTTHLSELIRRHAPELLSRQDVQSLLTNLKQEYPTVVEELVPAVLTVGEVQSVLQELLREGVSIRDLVTIAETLADRGRQTRDIEQLTEFVRGALSRQLSMQHRGEDGLLQAITLQPRLEQTLAAALQATDRGTAIVIEPDLMQRLLTKIASQVQAAAAAGVQPVLLCSARIRRPLRRLIERAMPALPVLAYAEVSGELDVQSAGTVEV